MNLRPRRLLPALLAFALAAAAAASAQEAKLPDIGSSAGRVLSPARQAEYGSMVLAQLRNAGYVLDDPLLDGWLRGVGQRLAETSDRPQQGFTFFLLRERQINAFATLGGYIGVNAGLVLAAKREDEVAGVMSHEIAHVTQQHVLRGAERAQRESLPILLAMLGTIVAAQQSSGNSSDDATSAAVLGGLSLIQQRQIDYTRDNEAEADRIGIRAMARSGYDPDGMADFFATLQSVVRLNQGEERTRTPGYLQTHPVTLTRISESRERAAQLRQQGIACTSTIASPDATRRESHACQPGYGGNRQAASNPLLPGGLQLAVAGVGGDTGDFGWARERLRVLSADTPAIAIREYRQMRAAKPLDDAQRYGLALAQLQAGHAQEAAEELRPLLATHADSLWVQIAMGQVEARLGRHAEVDRRFEALLAQRPSHRALVLSYAALLNERDTPVAGSRAVEVLRPLLGVGASDPVFQQTYARANEIAGDAVRAGEAWAEAAYLNGRPEQALVQLENLKKRGGLDYYARSRVEARIAAITPTVLELRRQGVKDEDATGRLGLRAAGL